MQASMYANQIQSKIDQNLQNRGTFVDHFQEVEYDQFNDNVSNRND